MMHHLDLRPIKNLAPEDKAKIPVSITPMPNGNLHVVSRYGDQVWDFYPYILQENLSPYMKQINWRIPMPDGLKLTDPKHAALLESAKDFIWSLFATPVEGRVRPKMLTLRTKVQDIRPLLRWMVSQGMTRFADLVGRTIEYVPVAKCHREGKSAAESTVVGRLIVVEDLYNQRGKINDALHKHPWPHESACALAGVRQGSAHLKPKTAFIPDAVASRLGLEALDYVRNRSSQILDALEEAQRLAQEKKNAGRGYYTMCTARTTAARKAGFQGSIDLTVEGSRLQTACCIIVFLFSGIRSSEMMSIAENCISHSRSRDGLIEVQWLHGTIYKTGIRPKRWLVPPVVAEAVAVLTRLTAPLREWLRREEKNIETHIHSSIGKERHRLVKQLNSVRGHKDKLFLTFRKTSSKAICVISSPTLNQHLKRFCTELDIRGDDDNPYPLHSHQFRRTYARFIARTELGDLLTLRDHFGHISLDMTTYYADGGADGYVADTELLEMVTKEKIDRQNEIMSNYLDSDTPLANGGHWLSSWRSLVRTAANKEDLIRELTGTVTLNGTGHSWCIGNTKGTCCGGMCVFEPQMCVDCRTGIIGQEHRSVWEGIREQQLEVLSLDDVGPGGRARALEILAKSEEVLKRLDSREAE